MNYTGRARISSRHPEAMAVCDRCKFTFSHSDLSFQQEWAGSKLINTHRLVCRECLDVPSNQRRTVVLPPDPVPVRNPRPQEAGWDETDGAGYDTSAVDLLFPVPD